MRFIFTLLVILIVGGSSFAQVDNNFLLGKFQPENSPIFDSIPDSLADRSGLLLQREALAAYQEMFEAAKADSINLVIRSATRNFYYQKKIWEGKWQGTRAVKGIDACKDDLTEKQKAFIILKYSSMPGTSRHHWGTDIDLNSFDNAYFSYGEGKRIYTWLQEHAANYGFYQPYTKKGTDRPHGYEEEKWHWSYFPLSDTYLKAYEQQLTNANIRGFYGAATTKEIDILKKYVSGIAKSPK